jgi:hypothetical protein
VVAARPAAIIRICMDISPSLCILLGNFGRCALVS